MNIEKYLVLNKYLLSLLGFEDVRGLLDELKNKSEGVDSDGRNYFVNALRGIENLKVQEDDLLRYDENIQLYVRKINYNREPVSLKYFQYLAVLFTEIVLDNLRNRKAEFLSELNRFLQEYRQEQDIKIISDFTENDLRKLALWMATGSGKTLIMHINYHQFFHYNLFHPDNILLITPNEGLSRQHYEELMKSGIPCSLYAEGNGGNNLFYSERGALVIEMTKFVEEKRGSGVTLAVDTFEGRNLIFVDEGHKGKKSEEQKWAKLRSRLAEDGFVFEYSATFGQILSERNKETLEEYAKSIIFDYSYKYFYLDGYGKDFSVLNVKQTGISKQEFQETFQKAMFIANLLSFYEQILVYEDNERLAREYNLEKPLWIFVGTTVTGKEEESDVIQIVKLIRKITQDEDWLEEQVEKILNGETELIGEDGGDVFANRFVYLRERSFTFNELYQKVLGGKGSLGIYELKNAEGELGLKIGEGEYFGVINIGDVSGFKKRLENEGITVEQDAITSSLFDNIKREDSRINVLIGSKKFIEGWDTWRVSSMGLLNMGKGQGPQIIQLFGRGVRLKGKGMSLKRSEDNLPVRPLEMLNIYGIKADYLSRFLKAISEEDVEFETIEIPVEPQHEKEWRSLHTLSKRDDKRFEEEEFLRLEINDEIYFTIDLLPKVIQHLAEEREEGVTVEQVGTDAEELTLPCDVLDLLDWDRIWQEVYDFKITRGYWNLVLDREVLRDLISSDRYKILALPDVMEIKSKEDIILLEDVALMVIRKYLDLFYKRDARRFETENLCYGRVGKQLTLFVFEKPGNQYSYAVQVDKKEKGLIKKIRNLAEDLERLHKDDAKSLPRIYFDRHLYVPMLLEDRKIHKISPPGLVESEKIFVQGLREYLRNNRGKFSGIEVYLLRNFPKSGVGFQLQWSGFYPDFIIWIKKGKKQVIAFIDPKGLEHTKGLDDEKIVFAGFEGSGTPRTVTIKDIQKSLAEKDVTLESFILSITPYTNLIKGRTNPPSKGEYVKRHVLFLEDDEDWPEQLFKSCIGN